MPDGNQTNNSQLIKLSEAQVLIIDSDLDGRATLKHDLRSLGFTKISVCDSVAKLGEEIRLDTPELVFFDIDKQRSHVCELLQAMRSGQLGKNPFVVAIALTWKAEHEAIAAALKAGADDIVAKPVGPSVLNERLINLIEQRKQFIATGEYVGPDRRPNNRPQSEDELDGFVVPNGLRHKTTGDKSAAVDQETVNKATRSVSIQKLFHLSRQVGALAGAIERQLIENPDTEIPTDSIGQISARLDEVSSIVREHEIESVAELVAVARAALGDIMATKKQPLAKNFELLRLQGLAIGAIMKESDKSARLLISELDKARVKVKGAAESSVAKAK